jgi:ABC-2 type transport system ATP-binding protein
MPVTSVHVERLTKRFGDTLALDDISFDASRGELFGFIGPDGAGKTTLFRILTTLLLADAGRCSVQGFDVVKDYRKIRNISGYMPGKFSLYQDLTVEENLTFFATIFGATIRENYDQLKEIYQQIEPFKNRKAGKLSGGMKQKLALSCAMIHKPEVLFLDEPTTGVDAVSRLEFWEMLKRLKAAGITILVSTPYMDEASLCDRVALMQNGRIMTISAPQEVIRNYPLSLFSVKAGDRSQLLGELREYPGAHSVYAFGQSAHVSVAGRNVEKDALFDFLTKNRREPVEITPIEATIEDCFMELMDTPSRADKAPLPPPPPFEAGSGAGYQPIKATDENIITVKNLVKKFGMFVANDHLTFEVKKGEIFGFLGANGAGKTTAIKILCGLSYPTSGQVSVAGFDIYTQREHVKRNIGYMSQRFSLYDDLTVFENIRFYGGIYGLKRKEIDSRSQALMQRLGFESSRNKLIRDIPLGWKQKLAFSVAILHNPKIVFLDEPTGGVDPITRRQFWDMIYEAAHDGITVFVTTHYMDEAEYCDRVSIMVDGRIAALDTPDHLKKQFNAPSMNEVFIKLARA